ncbi:hypothetical protein PLICRDRAFT_362528 [Plicaturopsis crispa FD-325 SS-3]|uniref:MINDY deubiquitinase domain-containing protein n=1 Tax=Plicaturopsis crispa FD-325 SS-3 TaxID=944288 RepID=A0A0C9SKU9_PLICR|nr:hypothetical protein PLICRDRAFT_362528 [Plicaturopsis crispa FD-325 SS-3]
MILLTIHSPSFLYLNLGGAEGALMHDPCYFFALVIASHLYRCIAVTVSICHTLILLLDVLSLRKPQCPRARGIPWQSVSTLPQTTMSVHEYPTQPAPSSSHTNPESPPVKSTAGVHSQTTPDRPQPEPATDYNSIPNPSVARQARAPSPSLQSSREDVWYLKEIGWKGGRTRIITQNFNGPCSFIAICNILILRGDIQILPPDRRTVSYELLSQLVAEYLLTHVPDVDISSALSVMPLTQKGMDLNPLFTSPTSFRPSTSDSTQPDPLALFAQTGIPLVHGWLVDPASTEAHAIQKMGVADYDGAVDKIVEADVLADGRLLGDGIAGNTGGQGGDRELTPEESEKIEHALTLRTFLHTTQSQLTYHGLFTLSSQDLIPPGSLVALFRSSHLSVLYKPPSNHHTAEIHPTSSTPNEKHPTEAATSSPVASSSALPEDTSNAHLETPPSDITTPLQEQFESTHILDPGPSVSPPGPEETSSHIYTLATDAAFLHEPSVVWERLDDIDGSGTVFVDSNFIRSSPAGGDVAGHTAETALAAFEAEAGLRPAQGPPGGDDDADLALARQLQAEENHYARAQRESAQQGSAQQDAPRERERVNGREQGTNELRKKPKKKTSCLIM